MSVAALLAGNVCRLHNLIKYRSPPWDCSARSKAHFCHVPTNPRSKKHGQQPNASDRGIVYLVSSSSRSAHSPPRASAGYPSLFLAATLRRPPKLRQDVAGHWPGLLDVNQGSSGLLLRLCPTTVGTPGAQQASACKTMVPYRDRQPRTHDTLARCNVSNIHRKSLSTHRGCFSCLTTCTSITCR